MGGKTASLILAVLLALSLGASPSAKNHRSTAAKNAFKRAQACPSTGQPRGPCPGWIIDHIVPLCAGGADTPANMQWQTRADSLVKDRSERQTCQALRRATAA
jgi:hypothetical protein